MWMTAAIETDAAHAEALADALAAVGAESVSVEDAWAGSARETPQFGEPGAPTTPLWERSRVVALFAPADDLAERVALALAASGLPATLAPDWQELADADWVRLTQSQFEPIRITERLWVVPSWHAPPDPAAINLVLDPGLAFGTGSHPTTRLCLEWLAAQVTPGCRLLDYGCGSGILAIAACKLGAAEAWGVDIDPHALAAAADNAAKNGVRLHLQSPEQPLDACFDLVVANILTNPLCLLAPLLSAAVRPGGRLALAGVLERQADQVIAAYAPYMTLTVSAVHEGWVRLEGIK